MSARIDAIAARLARTPDVRLSCVPDLPRADLAYLLDRLAAAERVVEAARHLQPLADGRLYQNIAMSGLAKALAAFPPEEE